MTDRANLFGKVVADSLLQYDPKEWVYLKKKVVDVFYDFEQQKAATAKPCQGYTATYGTPGNYSTPYPSTEASVHGQQTTTIVYQYAE